MKKYFFSLLFLGACRTEPPIVPENPTLVEGQDGFPQFGDLDADGDLDFVLVVSDFVANTTTLTPNINNNGVFTPGAPKQLNQAMFIVRVLDIDNDQRDDVVGVLNADIVRMLNDGQGGFNDPQLIFSTADSPLNLFVSDFDQDGDSDLIGGAFEIEIFVNEGNGGLNRLAFLPSQGNLPLPVQGDFDGDGDLDLAVRLSEPSSVLIYRNDGDLVLTEVGALPRTENLPSFLDVADFDLDGRDDLLLASSFMGGFEIYQGSDDLLFTEFQFVGIPNLLDAAAGNFDSNPGPDIAFLSFDSTLQVLSNNENQFVQGGLLTLPSIATFIEKVSLSTERDTAVISDNEAFDFIFFP